MALNSNAPTGVHSIYIPMYDGSEDPLAWLSRCNLFVDVHQTAEDEKIWIAMFWLTDIAYQFYCYIERNVGVLTWPEFVAAISTRFGVTQVESTLSIEASTKVLITSTSPTTSSPSPSPTAAMASATQTASISLPAVMVASATHAASVLCSPATPSAPSFEEPSLPVVVTGRTSLPGTATPVTPVQAEELVLQSLLAISALCVAPDVPTLLPAPAAAVLEFAAAPAQALLSATSAMTSELSSTAAPSLPPPTHLFMSQFVPFKSTEGKLGEDLQPESAVKSSESLVAQLKSTVVEPHPSPADASIGHSCATRLESSVPLSKPGAALLQCATLDASMASSNTCNMTGICKVHDMEERQALFVHTDSRIHTFHKELHSVGLDVLPLVDYVMEFSSLNRLCDLCVKGQAGAEKWSAIVPVQAHRRTLLGCEQQLVGDGASYPAFRKNAHASELHLCFALCSHTKDISNF